MDNSFDAIRRIREMEKARSSLHTMTANELMDKSFPPRSELVEGFLGPGTYLLAGDPKIGKSFLMTQLCASVAGGLPFLGMPTKPSAVLYLALEDTEVRLQERLVRMFGAADMGNLHLGFHIRSPGELTKDLSQFINDHPDTGLIVIDTLQCVRQTDGSDYSYSADYKAIQSFKVLSDRYHIALLLVHHTRKDQSNEDVFHMISGTNGLHGAADGAYILYRPKPQEDASLVYRGRDLPGGRMSLRFDQKSCLWQMVSREEGFDPVPDPLITTLDACIGSHWQGTATQLLDLLRTHDPALNCTPNVLTRKLNVLAGRLMKETGIKYTVSRTADSRELCFQKKNNDDHDGNDDFSGAV